jgi:putative adhesin
MNGMHRLVAAILVVGLAAPAAAQDSDSIARSIRQAAEEIAREVERTAQEAPAIAAIIRDTKITVARELKIAAEEIAREAAQAGRDASRAAAQTAREAERRRREETRRGPEVTENFSRTVRLGRDGTFSLANVSGDIEVTGGGGNDVRIEAVKRARHPDAAEAKAILQDMTIDISERGGSVDVRTEYPRYRNRRGNWYGSVDYTVTVPRDASVTLKSVSGDVKVTNVNGDLRTESVSGDVVMSKVGRVRFTKSVSGDVDIADGASDDVRAESVSGDVLMRNVKARVLSLQTVSGDVRLTDVDAERAQSRSVSGNVEYAGRLSPNGRYEFNTHSGNVRITPANAQGFDLEATTFSGTFRSDYPTTIQGSSLVPRRGPGNRTVRGTVGGGGAMLTLQSFSGNITIVRR